MAGQGLSGVGLCIISYKTRLYRGLLGWPHVREMKFLIMPSSFFLQGEVDILKSRLAKLEREKKELEEANEKLQQKVPKLIASRHTVTFPQNY